MLTEHFAAATRDDIVGKELSGLLVEQLEYAQLSFHRLFVHRETDGLEHDSYKYIKSHICYTSHRTD